MANQAAVGKCTGALGVALEKYPSLQRRERRLSVIGNAATAPTGIGIAAPVNTNGTLTARNWANTNLLTQLVRQGVVSSASAGNTGEIHGGVANLWRGNAPGLGGFAAKFVIGLSDAALVSGALTFVGFANTTSAIGATTDPTAITDCVGLAQITGAANWSITWNDASGTGTNVDLGTDFAIALSQVLTLELFCDCWDPNRAIHWSVSNDSTGAVKRGIIPGDHPTVPTITTAMTYHFSRSNNATAAATGLDYSDMIVYTRY